jgi:AraC-like DNA-binding protein
LAADARDPGKLAATLGPEWRDLYDRAEPAVRAGDDAAAVAIVEDRLIEKLLAATTDPRQVRAAARALQSTKGKFRMTDLAERCHLSSRQLERQFRERVGVSPKALARLIRFEEIRKRLMFDPGQSLTALAHEFEYADQSHFIHDFKELADRTPGEFAREMLALQDFFRDPDNVVFLQAPPSAAR